MLEWYRTNSDYQDIMQECEEFIVSLASDITGDTICRVGNHEVSLAAEWERITVAEAFRKHSPVSVKESVREGTFDEIFCIHVEPHLGLSRPVFLYDYPAALGSLARLRADDAEVAERFELFIGGMEMANGFSELTDAVEQRRRFQAEQQKMVQMGATPAPLPDRFLHDLERMPPTGGIAVGVDRLAMVLLGAATIDEVVTFIPEEL
jgi:lysyl-tRNA synthetase class 2